MQGGRKFLKTMRHMASWPKQTKMSWPKQTKMNRAETGDDMKDRRQSRRKEGRRKV